MKKYIFTSILLSLLLSACYKDKNNYVVAPINEAVITASSDNYAVEQLKELSIDPEIAHSLHNNDSYSYEWKIYEPKERDDFTGRIAYGEVIANTRNLKQVIYAPAGQYVLLYTVTNNNTGVKNFKEFRLTVNSGFYEGLVVAYDKNNQAELGFIRKDHEVGYDLIQQMNGGVTTAGAQQVNTLIVKSLRLITLTTANNHYQIDADAFTITADKSALFINTVGSFGNSYLGGNKMGWYNAPSDIYYINQGKVYADMGPDFVGEMAGQYSQPFYYSRGDYQLYPFLFNGASAATIFFYDNLNKKFLQASYNGRELSDVIRRPADNFDPSAVNKTAVGAMLGYGGNVYYVMEDNAGRDIYVMTQYSTAIANRIVHIDPASSPDFGRATIFDARTDQRYIYYAVDNKVYVYNLDTNSARVVLTLNSSEQIADIYVYRANMWQNSADEAFDKRIYIAANNGQNGKVYQYGLLPDGALSGSPEKEFTGFGRIVNVDYRNANE